MGLSFMAMPQIGTEIKFICSKNLASVSNFQSSLAIIKFIFFQFAKLYKYIWFLYIVDI